MIVLVHHTDGHVYRAFRAGGPLFFAAGSDAVRPFAARAVVFEVTTDAFRAAVAEGRTFEAPEDTAAAILAWADEAQPEDADELYPVPSMPEAVALAPRADRAPVAGQGSRLAVRTGHDLHRLFGGLTTATKDERYAFAARALGRPVAGFGGLSPLDVERVAEAVRAEVL